MHPDHDYLMLELENPLPACTIDLGAAQISYSYSYLNGAALNVPIFSDSIFSDLLDSFETLIQ